MIWSLIDPQTYMLTENFADCYNLLDNHEKKFEPNYLSNRS